MIPMRFSAETTANSQLVDLRPEPNEGNLAWLKRAEFHSGILLLGGCSVMHFRLRVAQSHVRADLLPSYWSLAGILDGPDAFYAVPLELRDDGGDVPVQNGVQYCQLADYDSPSRFPNIAVLSFTEDDATIDKYVKQVSSQRSIVDLPSLMVPWLAYAWAAGHQGNPLVEGLGLPSASFVAAVYGLAGIELTPGLPSSASCPEAIWQTARWWHTFYDFAGTAVGDNQATPTAPRGQVGLRQPAAAALPSAGL